jgi:hypothetical protein
VDANSFGSVVIVALYSRLNFVIYSLILGTFMSVCKTMLDIYQRAFTVGWRTLY